MAVEKRTGVRKKFRLWCEETYIFQGWVGHPCLEPVGSKTFGSKFGQQRISGPGLAQQRIFRSGIEPTGWYQAEKYYSFNFSFSQIILKVT